MAPGEPLLMLALRPWAFFGRLPFLAAIFIASLEPSSGKDATTYLPPGEGAAGVQVESRSGPRDPRARLPASAFSPKRSLGSQAPRSRDGIRVRMIGGNPSPQSDHDDVVAIRFLQDGVPNVCTGVAISGDAILTAGHCTCGAPGSYQVIAGPYSYKDIRGAYAVADVHAYPGYDCGQIPEQQRGLDLGLIRLRQRQDNLERLVRPVALLRDAINATASEFRVYGYGRTERGLLGERRDAIIPIATLTCSTPAWQHSGCAPFVEFVLSAQGTSSSGGLAALRDSCSGDSGGPVFWIDKDRAFLVGLVSRGLDVNVSVAGLPCGGGGIYSTVGRFSVIHWLESEGVSVCVNGSPCQTKSTFAQPRVTAVATPNPQPVCVEDEKEALFRALRYRHDQVIRMSQARGVPLPMFADNDPISVPEYAVRYLSAVERSALALYAADGDYHCVFLWTGESVKPFYVRRLQSPDAVFRLNTRLREMLLANELDSARLPHPKGENQSLFKPSRLLEQTGGGADTQTDHIRALSEIFFPPEFRDKWQNVKHLSLVSIKDMQTVPIALLEPFGDGRQVIDLFSVNYIAFLADIVRPNEPLRAAYDFPLIVGNPKTRNDPEWQFPDLPGAEKEAQEAFQEFGSRGVLLREEKATKRSVVGAMTNADLIYIAAHGLSDLEDALDRSFVALADDRLTAREVQSLSLANRRPLVVLSACQTGQGRTMEAGVIGIGRAFQKAHAANTVMSLWSVDDGATHDLMARFRKHLKSAAPAEALRRAMVEMRDQGCGAANAFCKPAFWSAFNVFGNQSGE